MKNWILILFVVIIIGVGLVIWFNSTVNGWKNKLNTAVSDIAIPLKQELKNAKEQITSFMRSRSDGHPVLDYQREASRGTWPASYGDPIRIPDVAGPIGSIYHPVNPTSHREAYDYGRPGPIPGEPMNVPVPMGSLKQYSISNIGAPRVPGLPTNMGFANVNSEIPLLQVNSGWDKIGVLTPLDKDFPDILNLYRRPIAPNQEVWDYVVQDKNQFVIPLKTTRFLEDGDTINNVIGKEYIGKWKANIFTENKWVWV